MKTWWWWLLSVVLVMHVLRCVRRIRPPPRGSIAVVVARYRERIDWLGRIADVDRIYLYLKGPELTTEENAALPPNTEVVRLPNVGRCDHTFLFHLYHRWDHLEDVTVFASGDGDDAYKGPKIQCVLRHALETRNTVLGGQAVEDVRTMMANFQLDRWRSTNTVNRNGEGDRDDMLLAGVRPFGAWYAAHFPELADTPIRVLCWRSVFAVSRRHVQQHPPSHYRRFLAELEIGSPRGVVRTGRRPRRIRIRRPVTTWSEHGVPFSIRYPPNASFIALRIA